MNCSCFVAHEAQWVRSESLQFVDGVATMSTVPADTSHIRKKKQHDQ